MIGPVKVPDKFSGPMTLIAGFLGRTQVFDGSRDGAGKLVEQRRINLVRAREFFYPNFFK